MAGVWYRAVVPAAALVAGLGGCGSNVSTPIGDGGIAVIVPMDTAEWPPIEPGAPPPENVNVALGTMGDIGYAHGRGYVDATLAETWAAMRDPDVCVDRRKVTSWTVTNDVEPGLAASYRIHNVVEALITVEFENTWRHEVTAGTPEAPAGVTATYQKTWGSSYISLLDGSVVARPTPQAENTTSLEIVQRIRATGQGPDTAGQILRDYFASVVARAHGNPLPTY